MKYTLKKLSPDIRDIIRRVSDSAARHTLPVYLVGGFVRDLILGVKNLDLDIVVEGDGIAFAEVLAREMNAKLISHRRFGTATLFFLQHKIDIATARRETYPQPAALPEVRPGTLREDLARRDFTINAMALDIGAGCSGSLLDYSGGRADLAAGKVRILHDASFIDDPTRILRAVRFEQRYGFKIDAATLKRMKEAVKTGMLDRTQPQRVRDEFILLLKEKDPVKAVRRLRQFTGFGFIHPRLRVTQATYAFMRSAGRQAGWFRRKYPGRRALDIWLLYFMALLDCLDEGAVNLLQKRFVFRRGEFMRMLSLKRLRRPGILALSRRESTPSRIFAVLEPLSYEVILMLKAKYRNRLLQRNLEDFFGVYNGMRLCVSGHDLRLSGVPPGPRYRTIFKKVLQAKLDGKITTQQHELALIRKLARPPA